MFTTVGDPHVRDRAGRRLRRRAVERRRVTRLPDDAVRAGRVDRPQNRADVVRILDAVEHDDQRRRGRGRVDELARRCSRAASSSSATTPWCTPPRASAIERVGVDALDRHACFARASASASSMRRSLRAADAQPSHASRAQRLEHGIDAVDEHRCQAQLER